MSCRKHQTLPFSALVSPFSSAFERCFGARGPRKLQLTRLEFSGNFVPASVAPISLATTATEWLNNRAGLLAKRLVQLDFQLNFGGSSRSMFRLVLGLLDITSFSYRYHCVIHG